MLKKLKNVPLFPLFPFAPLLIAGSAIALEAFILARLRRLARSVDKLAQSQQAIPMPA